MTNALPTDVNNLFKISEKEKVIAVALSGGGDSMALAHMICEWAVKNDKHIHLLTVNHNLRAEAKAEAQQVAAWVKDFPSAQHFILDWDHNHPDTAIMERARQARYDLMAAHCKTYDIQTLAVAHHVDDQMETFFFRLAKGSGLDGLTGMREWTDRDGIKIYRPLLQYSHAGLIQYCRDKGVQWIEDPSNENENYARPRIRKMLQNEGLDGKRFASTLDRLARAHEALNWLEGRARVQSLLADGAIDYAVLRSYPIDIQIRVLQKLIAENGEVTHNYPPKLERVEEIIKTLKPSQSATLHGCVLTLSKDGKTLEIKRSAA